MSQQQDIYGFVIWLSGWMGLIAYCCWAFIPRNVLAAFGITYYPSKYWAVAIPLYVCVSLVAVAAIYTFYNMSTVPDMDDPRSVGDNYGKRQQQVAAGLIFDLSKDTPIITDLTPEEASYLLYAQEKSLAE